MQATQTDANPLLETAELPRFSAITADHVEPAVRGVLDRQRAKLVELETAGEPGLAWLEACEAVHERIHDVWGPVAHLNAVKSEPALRDAYNRCLPLVTEFETDLGHNRALYERFLALEKRVPDNPVANALVDLALRDFRLAGVGLAGQAKSDFREVMLELAAKQARFEQNLLDATDAFSYHERDEKALIGLPRMVLERARDAAHQQNMDGYLFTLDAPTYLAVVAHAEAPALRERYYRAWVTRASEQGPGDWDNAPLIAEILRLRQREAELLDFPNYASLSLATKMAKSPDEVVGFLEDLAARARDVAERELSELEAYAGAKLDAWDIAFYAEKLKKARFDLAEEELREYFPLRRVLDGLFELTSSLFAVTVSRAEAQTSWHPSVEYYELRNADGATIGGFFADFFARPNKRGGAWMDVCFNRARLGARRRNPIAHLVCNFAPPLGTAPSLLTHTDVITLFHEFGHTLHHLLTEIDYPSVAGINGVAWDAVELPSQFLENYAWQPDVLKRISAHAETGAPLSDEKIATLDASRHFLAGLAMLRQIEFALFDFRIHTEPEPPSAERVREILGRVREQVAVVRPPAFNRFECSFSHIFGGGYAAGYYSYKWAEVLAADAFSAFVEAGSRDRDTAERFRRSILAVGGSRDALDAFVDFRGRPPRLEPLLEQSGITSQPSH
jgi:oligopeptidase A